MPAIPSAPREGMSPEQIAALAVLDATGLERLRVRVRRSPPHCAAPGLGGGKHGVVGR